MNWLQGFSPHCLIQCCTHWAGGWEGGLAPYREFLLFRLRAISLTACAWDITILKPYCRKTETHTHRQDTGCGEDGEEEGVMSTCTTPIRVTLCAWVSTRSLHAVCHRSVPGSSWWLSSTWCTRARRLFGWRGGSSWWFCCWKLSRSCNRWKVCRRPGLDSVVFWLFNFKSSVQTQPVSCIYLEFEWPLFKVSGAQREAEGENYREEGLTEKLWWLLRLQMHHGRRLLFYKLPLCNWAAQSSCSVLPSVCCL